VRPWSGPHPGAKIVADHPSRGYFVAARPICVSRGVHLGKIGWEKDYRKDYGVEKVPTWGFCTSPVVARGKVVIHPGGKGGLVALDPETGKQAWATPDTDPNYSTFVVEKFGGVEQLVGYDATSLGGWDAGTGKRLWRVPVESKGYVVPSPLKVGERLFVTDDSNGPRLFAFKAGGVIDPKPAAEAEKPAPESYTPVASGDIVLGLAKGLTALDAKTLKVLYTVDDERALQDECPLIVAGGRGLALTPSGRAVCFTFDRKGVEVTGSTKVCGNTRAHPAVADGVLYVRDGKALKAYSLAPPK
ncbi:MAG: hypothetical protein FJ304_27635, partial [Planctomycetes bacterium]|nr:hypothetical protein [Planctomycetota bacterium]